MSVVPYESLPRAWIDLMPAAAELAKQVANTEFVPKSLRGNSAAIAACILYGDELGIGPLQSLAKIAVIEGKPSLSAEAQRALILAAGHDMWVVESSNTKVTVAGRRSNSEHTSTVTWTLDDAKRAGIGGRQNWRTYPRQMLMARATAELARLIFADAVGGLLATEELEDDDGELGEATPTASTRKRRSTAKPETTNRATPAQNGEGPELPPLPDVAPSPAGSGSPLETPPLLAGDKTAGEPSNALEAAASDPSDAGGVADDLGGSSSPAAQLKPTPGQKKKIGVLLNELRDQKAVVSTEQLWTKVAGARNVDVDTMIELLGGYDDERVLHFGPLLADMDRQEAARLIDYFERKAQT